MIRMIADAIEPSIPSGEVTYRATQVSEGAVVFEGFVLGYFITDREYKDLQTKIEALERHNEMLRTVSEQRDKEIAERAFEAGDSVRIPKDIYEAYLKNEMTSEMFPRLLKSISVKPGFNDYWQQVKGEK